MTVTDTTTYLQRIGSLIRDARRHKGLTQTELARSLGTSQSAVVRIEQGQQNLSLETLARIGESLDSEFVSLGHSGPQHLRIVGGQKLHGSIDVKTSKNAAVALLCASLLNRGRTTLRNLARIEEVNRILEVLSLDRGQDPLAARQQRPRDRAPGPPRPRRHRRRGGPPHPHGDHVPRPAPARPGAASGCRTPGAATSAPAPSSPTCPPCGPSGSTSWPPTASTRRRPTRRRRPARPIVLTERGDTVTENVLLAAARHDGVTVIRNASPNYMVQDLCFFLEKLGVRIEGIGTTTLTVHGRGRPSTSTSSTPPRRTPSRR